MLQGAICHCCHLGPPSADFLFSSKACPPPAVSGETPPALQVASWGAWRLPASFLVVRGCTVSHTCAAQCRVQGQDHLHPSQGQGPFSSSCLGTALLSTLTLLRPGGSSSVHGQCPALEVPAVGSVAACWCQESSPIGDRACGCLL